MNTWHFGCGMDQTSRFSGRHETVLWFTKGRKPFFDLDSVRAPQKSAASGVTRARARGGISSNPKGKNPGDVWEIPNVKAAHVEKVGHPCQFPVGLADPIHRRNVSSGRPRLRSVRRIRFNGHQDNLQ